MTIGLNITSALVVRFARVLSAARRRSEAGARAPARTRRGAFARMPRALGLSLGVLLGGLLVLLPARGHAADGILCPIVGPGGIPNLLADAPQLERMTTTNTVDLANEINGLIQRLKDEKKDISNDEITNVLIAAYCPVVAREKNLSATEKWKLMHRFSSVVLQQIAANTMPPGSLIIASIPLPPVVFRDLSTQAEAAGQSPAQFMADILTKAAGP